MTTTPVPVGLIVGLAVLAVLLIVLGIGIRSLAIIIVGDPDEKQMTKLESQSADGAPPSSPADIELESRIDTLADGDSNDLEIDNLKVWLRAAWAHLTEEQKQTILAQNPVQIYNT